MATTKHRRLWNISHKNYLQKNLAFLRAIQSVLSLANQDRLEDEVNAFLLKTHQIGLNKLAADVAARNATGQQDEAAVASQELKSKEKLKCALPKRVVSECFGRTGAILDNVQSVESYIRSTAELEPYVSGLLVLPNNLLHRGKKVRLCRGLVEPLGSDWEKAVSHHCKGPIEVDPKFLSAALGHRELTLEGAIVVMDVLGDFLMEKFGVRAHYYQLLDGPTVYEDWRHADYAGTQSQSTLEPFKPFVKQQIIDQATLVSNAHPKVDPKPSPDESVKVAVEPDTVQKTKINEPLDSETVEPIVPKGPVKSGAEHHAGSIHRNAAATVHPIHVVNKVTIGDSKQELTVNRANELGPAILALIATVGLVVLCVVAWWIFRDSPEKENPKLANTVVLGESSTIELVEAPFDKVMKEPGFLRLSTDFLNKMLYLEDDVLEDIAAYTNKVDFPTSAIFYACDFPDEFETDQYRCEIKSDQPGMAISYIIKDVTPYRVSKGLSQTQFDLKEIDRPVTFATFLFPKDIDAEHSVFLEYRPVLKGQNQ